MNQTLLTTREAAGHTRLSKRTLEDYRTKGCGPIYRRLGKRILYRLADLEIWIDARAYTSTSEYPETKEAA